MEKTLLKIVTAHMTPSRAEKGLETHRCSINTAVTLVKALTETRALVNF